MTIVEDSRRAAKMKLFFLPHAIRQMSRPERMITPQEVERVVMMGELVEDYPHDSRGHNGMYSLQRSDGERDGSLQSGPKRLSRILGCCAGVGLHPMRRALFRVSGSRADSESLSRPRP